MNFPYQKGIAWIVKTKRKFIKSPFCALRYFKKPSIESLVCGDLYIIHGSDIIVQWQVKGAIAVKLMGSPKIFLRKTFSFITADYFQPSIKLWAFGLGGFSRKELPIKIHLFKKHVFQDCLFDVLKSSALGDFHVNIGINRRQIAQKYSIEPSLPKIFLAEELNIPTQGKELSDRLGRDITNGFLQSRFALPIEDNNILRSDIVENEIEILYLEENITEIRKYINQK